MQYRFYMMALPLLITPVSPALAQWIGNAAVHYEFSDNISNAHFPVDINSDSVFYGKLSVGRYFQLADFTGLSITTDIGGANYLRFNGLNNVSYGASGTLRHKFGVGNSVPWVSVSGAVAYHDFEHAPRDGRRYNLGITIGKRLGERWELQLGYRYDEHISDRIYNIPGLTQASFDDEHPPIPIYGDAFNVAGHNVFLMGIFTVTEQLTAYASYTRREGGTTSTVNRNPEVLEYADAIALDNAFGSGHYAYRADAGSDIFAVGINWALSNHAALNLGYKRMNCHVAHGLNYANNTGQLSLLYTF